jgi:trehalose 6-phosphate phosphatase
MSPQTALAALMGHALCLDVDGTILDIASTPDTVQVPGWMVPLLASLHGRLDGAVAFVSGRPIADIDRLFAPLILPAIGVHGGEFRMPGGPITRDDELSGQIAAIKPFLARCIQPMRGVLLEDKHSVIALHYRRAPEFGREVLRIAELALASMGGDFAVLVGKCVVEIRPRHLTKGTALQRLMETPPFRGRTPIFAGDDVSDEDAFEVVNRLGGISVRVGEPMRTAATCHLSDPEQLRRWLQEIAAS